jgi:hypothetical protein
MSNLQSQLRDLASAFAAQMVDAIRGASLQELASAGGRIREDSPRPFASSGAARKAVTEVTEAAPVKAPRDNGRLPRRSADEIAAHLSKIVSLLQKHKAGMRAEEIRSNLGMLPKEMPRILKEGLAKKKLTSKGQKRATTYHAR